MIKISEALKWRKWSSIAVFVLSATGAGISPILIDEQSTNRSPVLPWPSSYEGRQLQELTLTEREQSFIDGFPGAVARFSDGNRELIIRQVNSPTRMLHPAAECFRGAGYSIVPISARENAAGVVQACFEAKKSGQTFRVCEHIKDELGRNWSDVSAWYWHAPGQHYLNESPVHWWSFVVAEQIESKR